MRIDYLREKGAEGITLPFRFYTGRDFQVMYFGIDFLPASSPESNIDELSAAVSVRGGIVAGIIQVQPRLDRKVLRNIQLYVQ